MTPQQKTLVQESFKKVAPIAPLAADLFYARLFEIDPELRLLFKSDMKRQGMTLMTMIGTAVRGLDNPDALVPVLKNLGRRHMVYGVKDKHYGTVAQALLDTLQHAMGPEFDDEMRAAWTAVYSLMASVMQMGAREVVETPAANDPAPLKMHQTLL